jgi:hypothetical protein
MFTSIFCQNKGDNLLPGYLNGHPQGPLVEHVQEARIVTGRTMFQIKSEKKVTLKVYHCYFRHKFSAILILSSLEPSGTWWLMLWPWLLYTTMTNFQGEILFTFLLCIVHPFTLYWESPSACAPYGALNGVSSVIPVANYPPCFDKIPI